MQWSPPYCPCNSPQVITVHIEEIWQSAVLLWLAIIMNDQNFENPPKKATDLFYLHIVSHVLYLFLFSYQTYKVMWYTSFNQTALQSSVSSDLALESIFLTTLRAQEWAQYGLNSYGPLQGWTEIALLYSSCTKILNRKCCFFIHSNAATVAWERDRGSSLSISRVSWWYCATELCYHCSDLIIMPFLNCILIVPCCNIGLIMLERQKPCAKKT